MQKRKKKYKRILPNKLIKFHGLKIYTPNSPLTINSHFYYISLCSFCLYIHYLHIICIYTDIITLKIHCKFAFLYI